MSDDKKVTELSKKFPNRLRTGDIVMPDGDVFTEEEITAGTERAVDRILQENREKLIKKQHKKEI